MALFLIRRLPEFLGSIRQWAWLRSFAGFYRTRIERKFSPMYVYGGDRRTIYIYIYIYGLRTAIRFMWGSLRLAPMIASYPGIRGEGRRKRTPGAHCLHMRLIKSPFCNDNVFAWGGFCS